MANYNVPLQPPGAFRFDRPDEWAKWKRHFEQFRLASGLSAESEERQVCIHFSRYGVPATLLSDNGPQFSSAEMKEFCKLCYFDHVTSSPYYPQSNGMVERTVRTVKKFF